MEKVTKIVAILILVVSIGFLFFAAKTINRIQLQKKLIVSLQDSVSSLQNTVNSSTETINLARDEISFLRTLAAQLKKEVAKAIAEKEKAEKELIEAKNRNEKLNAELKAEKARNAILTEQLKTQQPQGMGTTIPEGASLEVMVSKLAQKLKETENKLSISENRLDTLESLGILLERESIVQSGEGTPQVVKEIEGKIIDIEPNGIVSVNFKGSLKPQKGTTFYVIDSNHVKAKLVLKDIYNTLMVAQMDIENLDYNIKSGDKIKLILWTEK